MSEAGQARHSRPRGLINIRMTDQDRELIDRAAQAEGTNRSEFMLRAARQAARDALLDRTFILVDAATRAAFLEQMDGPAGDNAKLERLMKSRSPWE